MRRNKFSLSHYKLATMNQGFLYPLTWFEVVPGDTVQMATSMLIRVSPLLAPIMHPVAVKIHHWFVPNRLIWEDFEDFITGGPDGNDSSVHPYREKNSGSINEGTIYDYMGIPPGDYTGLNLNYNALPFRAYNLIFNEHYRDQDLVTELTVNVGSGLDSTSYDLQRVAWEKDYFTTARPWEQKGTAVTIPISGTIDPGIGGGPKFEDSGGTQSGANLVAQAGAAKDVTHGMGVLASPDSLVWNDPDLSLDGANIDINDLRLALAIQRYKEARAQFGSRYVEYLRYLGVRSSDARLQNPEYLGGGRQIIQFSEVLQTGEGTNYVGTMRGHGIGALRTRRFRRFFEEHGIVMTLASVVPKAIYSQSLDRGFLRETKEDYFQRELQHIGEQEVTNREVYALHTSPTTVFGYVPRYDEYRYKMSSIAGEFRSTLDEWHMARIFASNPSLNQSFIEANPTNRIYASTATDELYVMANHSIQARRPMAKFAKPRLM